MTTTTRDNPVEQRCTVCGQLFQRFNRSSYKCPPCRRAVYANTRESERDKARQRYRRDREAIKLRRRKTLKRRNEWVVAYQARPEEQPKQVARLALRYAVRHGKITRLPCEVCGNPRAHGHHDDYSKPFDVRWLCAQHHHDIHREQRDAAS